VTGDGGGRGKKKGKKKKERLKLRETLQRADLSSSSQGAIADINIKKKKKKKGKVTQQNDQGRRRPKPEARGGERSINGKGGIQGDQARAHNLFYTRAFGQGGRDHRKGTLLGRKKARTMETAQKTQGAPKSEKPIKGSKIGNNGA